ncbi:MAG: hypothetical protein LBC35_06210 [Coriobacteriales bacterium]|jgi:hypothetical protein|nr:hypothetical protein [Coriobacteriales bacterium]
MSDIVNAMITGFGTAATSIVSGIVSLLPIVIPIASAFVLISVGYRVFKRFAR